MSIVKTWSSLKFKAWHYRIHVYWNIKLLLIVYTLCVSWCTPWSGPSHPASWRPAGSRGAWGWRGSSAPPPPPRPCQPADSRQTLWSPDLDIHRLTWYQLDLESLESSLGLMWDLKLIQYFTDSPHLGGVWRAQDRSRCHTPWRGRTCPRPRAVPEIVLSLWPDVELLPGARTGGRRGWRLLGRGWPATRRVRGRAGRGARPGRSWRPMPGAASGKIIIIIIIVVIVITISSLSYLVTVKIQAEFEDHPRYE